ncbi:MAG: hypothetical protein DRI90_00345 [Deltaproteobacteria bacterium]|nr:MAG: hypothetical protein DRI90_00345 [Deltaproteobacteria bacterium]
MKRGLTKVLGFVIGVGLSAFGTGCSQECVVTGCSGNICADGTESSACDWNCVYGCYDHAVCEEQDDGECGWTKTEAFDQCAADCSATGS